VRIIKVLEVLAAVTFLFLSFILSKELFLLYLKKNSIDIVQKNTKMSFESGNLVLTTERFLLKNPKLEVELKNGKFSLNIWESIKSFDLIFDKVKISEIYVEKKEKDERSKYFPAITLKLPFYVKDFETGKVEVKAPDFYLVGESISINHKSFQIEKLEGSAYGKNFSLKPLKGRIVNDLLNFSNLLFSFDKYLITGRGKLAKDLSFLDFNGAVKSNDLNLLINLKKENEFLSFKGSVKYGSFSTLRYYLYGKLSRNLEIFSGKFYYQQVEGFLKGFLNFEEIKVSGKIKGERLELPFGALENLNGNFNVEGSYKEPSVELFIQSKKAKTEILSLEDLLARIFFKGRKKEYEIFLESKNLNLSLKLKGNNGTGELKLKSFDIDTLSFVVNERKKFKSWMPKLILS